MSEQEIRPKGPEKFEDCHVCGHQPQYIMEMTTRRIDGVKCDPRPCHSYICTHCDEHACGCDEKTYAGLEWNGRQLKAKERQNSDKPCC